MDLSEEEASEIRLRAARLAYMWGCAAGAGLEAPLAAERAEYWAWRAEREVLSLRDFSDLRVGFQVGGWGVESFEGWEDLSLRDLSDLRTALCRTAHIVVMNVDSSHIPCSNTPTGAAAAWH